LGLQEDLLRLSAQRFAEARPVLGPADSAESSAATASASFASTEAASSADTFLVMIGRGGSDLDAREEMHRFVAARLLRTPVAGVTVGFLAGPGPDLNDALDAAEQSGLRRIVVQPHLLYQGRLVRQVRQAVETRAMRRPDLAWFLAEHLGPANEVIYTLMGNYAG
jgi:sirohydrochlorin ferrochelatase